MKKHFLFISLILLFSCTGKIDEDNLVVGSKKFTESVILGNIINLTLEKNNIASTHKDQLGGTSILWNSLLKGEIDVYPEYTGTIIHEILHGNEIANFDSLKTALNKFGIGITDPLGFNNTYALGVNRKIASENNLQRISEINKFPKLKIGFTNEFMDRKDGWPGLRERYNLIHTDVAGLDHDLAYSALSSNSIDIMDVYTTDAEIEYYNIKLLEDDLNYFPEYLAVVLYRLDISDEAISLIKSLENNMSSNVMSKMNGEVKIKKRHESVVAAEFLNKFFQTNIKMSQPKWQDRVFKRTIEHLELVSISLILAILFSIPLGIIAYKNKKFGQLIIASVNILQTIPSLALLVFMIPLLGIGTIPAIAALFLYSLLPIVRNTYLGLNDIPGNLRESAEVLGLSNNYILTKIELPLAASSILTGIKTSSVINIGTATLGALIGAGGYGQPILTGIRLDSTMLILEGAIPAALLAMVVQYGFEYLEKFVVPKGLKV